MWRPFVAQNHTARCLAFPFRFALHQHRNTAGQDVNFACLASGDVGQVRDLTFEIGDFLFELFHVTHLARRRALRKPCLAPLAHAG